MKIEHSFEVEAPIQTVWDALTDIPRVAPCLPGADITEKQDDGSYAGSFTVKLGPTTAAYRGVLRMEDLDESNHTATMRGDGTDKRGQGGVKATVKSQLREESGVTHVDIDTDLNITGRLARFGRGGMVQDVSTKLLDRFAECLKADLTAGGAGERAAAGGEAGGADGDGGAASEGAAAAGVAGAGDGAAAADDPGAGDDAAGAADAATSEAAGAGGAAASAASSGPAPGSGGPAPGSGEPTPGSGGPTPGSGEPSAPRPAAEPLDAGALAGEVMAERAKKAAPALLALALVLVWLLRRRS